ncbi:MAG: TIGR02147 family protein [Oligoflexia bacterium]|nr:TIGR02147 family protein [Oligoflexia bacterium]
MQEQLAIQKLLNGKYEEARAKNPAFSLRAFSRRLEVSPSTLTRVLSGQRRVSRPLAERLCRKLCLDPQERSELMGSFPSRRPARRAHANGGKDDVSLLQLTADQFRIISEWHHFAILSLMRTRDFKSVPGWIANRLGISVREAEAALERLERLEMIRRGSNGKWVRTRSRFRTTDDVLDLSLQKAHRQDLELAAEALATVPVELRDFSSITMPAHPRLLPRAKELIRKCQNDLSALLESEPGTEVYQLYVQLFPLTKVQLKETES